MKYREVQRSESITVMILLTLSGGLQDAYSYFVRREVFANAQTGNIVLLSMNLFTGNFKTALRYLIPILFFACGIFISEQIRGRFKFNGRIHWRQVVLLIEVLLLTLVSVMPRGEYINILANSMTSFACALQVQSFRKFNGYNYSSTMCIGNLRSATESLSAYVRLKEKILLKRSLYYFFVIFVFFMGAGIASILIRLSEDKKTLIILISSILLMVAFIYMLYNQESDEEKYHRLNSKK